MISRRARFIIAPIIVFAGAFDYAFFMYSPAKPYIINDSAVEIMQVRYMDWLPIKPIIGTYPGGNVDFIESLMPYYYKVWTAFLDDTILTYQIAMMCIFAFTCLAFYIFLSLHFDVLTTLFGTVAYTVSAYSVWPTLVLTRNGASALGAILTFIAIDGFLKRKSWKSLICLCSILVATLLIYSSFKVFVLAVVGCVFIHLCLEQKRKLAVGFLASMLFTGLIFIIFISLQLSPLDFFVRGDYVIRNTGILADPWKYPLYLLRSISLPVYESPIGFPADAVHRYFNRHSLNVLLWFFLAGGLLKTFFKNRSRKYPEQLFFAIWLVSSLGLTLGGPSLKSQFVLWPLTLYFTASGADWIFGAIKYQRYKKVLMAMILITVTITEYRHMKLKVTPNYDNANEAAGYLLGKWIGTQVDNYEYIYTVSWNIDAQRLFHPDFTNKLIRIDNKADISSVLLDSTRQTNCLFIIPTKAWEIFVKYDKKPCERLIERTFGSESFTFLDRNFCR